MVYFFRQNNRWSELSPNGTAPTTRDQHTSVWSDVADGMYVFGGFQRSDGRSLSVNGPRDSGMCRGTPRLRQVLLLPLHVFAEVLIIFRSMTLTFTTARRREDGISQEAQKFLNKVVLK